MAVAEVFVPIVMFIVMGAVIVTYFYYRARERESIIAQNFTAEELTAVFNRRKYKNYLIPVGIIMVFFGVGLGLGIWLEEWTHKKFMVPLFLFVSTGLGFILAGYLNDKKNDKELK